MNSRPSAGGDFVEQAKKPGLVRSALDKAGFADAEVAPLA
jgi:hypothetical protein